MDIDASILQNFFKKVTLATTIPSVRLVSQSEGLFTRMSYNDHIVVEGTLNPSAFHKYEQGLTLDIRESMRFNKIISSFKDKLNISKKDVNILMKSVNKVAYFKSANAIDNFKAEPLILQWDSGVDISMNFIKEIISNMNNVESDNITLEIKNKVLTATTKGQEDLVEETLSVTYKDCKFQMAADYFKKIFGVMDSE